MYSAKMRFVDVPDNVVIPPMDEEYAMQSDKPLHIMWSSWVLYFPLYDGGA